MFPEVASCQWWIGALHGEPWMNWRIKWRCLIKMETDVPPWLSFPWLTKTCMGYPYWIVSHIVQGWNCVRSALYPAYIWSPKIPETPCGLGGCAPNPSCEPIPQNGTWHKMHPIDRRPCKIRTSIPPRVLVLQICLFWELLSIRWPNWSGCHVR